ncbi:hypothetical protein TKK_0005491 [Trichogramma kaykai]|uniref:Uncharacterized protein n=1 Tax=Trichogramma kaykai TaxID=54128 RepID=A0ABD2XH54_9HYME
MKKSTGSGNKGKNRNKKEPKAPNKKPYGFCCDERRDPQLPQPPSDPSLDTVILDAAGPNLRLRIEEKDKVYAPAPRKLVSNHARGRNAT